MDEAVESEQGTSGNTEAPIRSRALAAELNAFCSGFRLTPRESEIVGVLVQGTVRIKDIALRMKLSPNTINNHVNSIFGKTGARSKSQLLVMFLDRISSDLQWIRLLRRRPSVLVASRDPGLIELFSNVFQKRDVRFYSTTVCDLGSKEFRDAVEQTSPHFVVLDLDHCEAPANLNMKGMLRAGQLGDIEEPMVLWVGSDGKRIERCRAMGSGALDCVKKPLTEQDLETVLSLLIAHYAEDGQDRERLLREENIELLKARHEIVVTPEKAGRGGLFIDSDELNGLFDHSVKEGDWVDLQLKWDSAAGASKRVPGQIAWTGRSGAGVRLFQSEAGHRRSWSDFVGRHSIQSYIPWQEA